MEGNFVEQNNGTERFPNQEEIKKIFEIILKGKEYKELRIESDAQGVSLYEIEVILENGEKIEYNFQRADYDYKNSSLPANARFSASIHMTNYNTDNIPFSGECVANYIDGKWEYLS